MRIPQDIENQITKYTDENPARIEWNPNDFYGHQGKGTLEQILEKGLLDFENELIDLNLEYFTEIEDQIYNDMLGEFGFFLLPYFKKEYPGETDASYETLMREYLQYNFPLSIDINLDQIIAYLPNILCLIPIFSNYDCANSFDTYEPETYLFEAHRPVREGITVNDLLWEHTNGCYGGALLCFAFTCDLKKYFELEENFGSYINIPKGTQFGFYSSFQGSASVFEKRTIADMRIPKHYGPTKYDHLDIIADLEQSYSMEDIFGSVNFIDEQDITVE